jgi:hypothetical protein
MLPWRHFIPVDADFANLPGRVRWANGHPRHAERIAVEAVALYRRYMRRAGTRAYLRALFTAYAARLSYEPRLLPGAIALDTVLDADYRRRECTGAAGSALPYFANYSVGSLAPFYGEDVAGD